jgi:tRNA1Val (adenine37-N6)-methyltransferase
MKHLTKDTLIWPDLFIWQEKDGYRFSMDSVLLARLLNPKPYSTILEIGTGVGVVLLLVSRLFKFKRVVGIEIQRDLCKLAGRNIRMNKGCSNIMIYRADIKNYASNQKELYDIIISNPPYYEKGTGRLSKNKQELVARHEISLDLTTLLTASSKLLKPKGELNLIYTAQRSAELFQKMKESGIEPKLALYVYPSLEEQADLIWVRGVKGGGKNLKILPPIITRNKRGNPTTVVKAFYTKNSHKLADLYPEAI